MNQLPDFVYFNHSIHINKGVGCNTCHGPVDQMPLMYQQESLQMEWCLDCHRDAGKIICARAIRYSTCATSRRRRATPVIVDGQSYTDQVELGAALIKKYKLRSVRDITSCSTCHR